jgi:hypothetical protein
MNGQLRDEVRSRARNRCEYCCLPQWLDPLMFEIEHVLARKHHGETTLENLALACFACNSYKGPNIAGRDPDSVQIVRLFHPRTDKWTDHFQWQGPVLVGKTPVGRATVDVLRINLAPRISQRSELMAAGDFWNEGAS